MNCTGEHDPPVNATHQMVAMVYPPEIPVELRAPHMAEFVPVEEYLCAACQTAFAMRETKAVRRFASKLSETGADECCYLSYVEPDGGGDG